MSITTNELAKLILVLCIVFLISCDSRKENREKLESLKIMDSTSENVKAGELLAKQYCARCHEFVAPEILPKKYWENVLSKMSMYLGINDGSNPQQLNTSLAFKRLDSAGIFPSKRLVNDQQWKLIKQYYLSNSIGKLDLGKRPEINFDLSQFHVKPVHLSNIMRQATFVKVLDKNKIGVGFSSQTGVHEFCIMDMRGRELERVLIPSPLTSISHVENELIMTFMGPFVADDDPVGIVGKLKIDKEFNFKSSVLPILQKRERPIHVNSSDLNNDGRVDLIVAEFGKYLGGLNWYMADKLGGYEKKNLYLGPGAISSVVDDVNNDGLPDVYALISQGDEGVYLYINKGGGEFSEKKVLEFPPYYGSTQIEVLDFDGDGFKDILYSNGDSGDFGIPSKPFHGIRLFKNYNNESYKEAWFYPQQGTYKTNVVDFDRDGDLDIAAIGFFAYRTIPEESFLFLENNGIVDGKRNFKANSFKEAVKSSYMVMDAGDVDGDGDIDLVLGASTTLMGMNSLGRQLNTWEEKGGLLVVLENTLY